jgi:SAM-dependent methyltransferase
MLADLDAPSYLRTVQAVDEAWRTSDPEGLPPGGVPFLPMKVGDFALLLAEAVPAAGGVRFLDAGCGPGTKLWLAEYWYRLRVTGVDALPAHVAAANEGRDPPVAVQADLRDWAGFGGFDIVLLNRPVQGSQMPVFERRVMAALAPGAVLIHANGVTDPGTELGWELVYLWPTGGSPVTGVWRKPAAGHDVWGADFGQVGGRA